MTAHRNKLVINGHFGELSTGKAVTAVKACFESRD